MKSDRILIRGLALQVRIGITAAERAHPQILRMDADIEPHVPFERLDEHLNRTVDYHAVCLRLEELAKSQEWQLVETLSLESARLILREFSAEAAAITLRKFVLPQTESVGARVELRRV